MPERTALGVELLRARRMAGKVMRDCATLLGITIEGYRQKEIGQSPVSGMELALLADLYGAPIGRLFPSYTPTPAERALARHIAPVTEQEEA